jgi:CBS domain-containing protein
MQTHPSQQDNHQKERSGPGPCSTVSELMSRSIALTSRDDTVKEAVVAMARHGVDAIPVVDAQKKLIGSISHQGIAIRAATGDKPVDELHVKDAMSSDTTSLSVSATVSDALGLMVRRRFTWLPVVTRDRLVVGMLALSDILSRAASPRDSRGAWLETGYRPAARHS